MVEIKMTVGPNGQLPIKKTDGSAGFDIHTAVDAVIPVGDVVMVSTELKSEIPNGYYVQVRPRSGLAAKHGIVTRTSGVIDSDYRGEWMVPLHNLGKVEYRIKKGDAIAQGLVLPVLPVQITQVDSLSETKRGEGGFGSTGR